MAAKLYRISSSVFKIENLQKGRGSVKKRGQDLVRIINTEIHYKQNSTREY